MPTSRTLINDSWSRRCYHHHRCCRRCLCRCYWREWQRRERLVLLLLLISGAMYALCFFWLCDPADQNWEEAFDAADISDRQSAIKSHGPLAHRDSDKMDDASRMRKRRNILSHFCFLRSVSGGEDAATIDPTFRSNVLVFRRRPALYCPAGKVASTFLTRFFVAAEETRPVVSPYVISPEKAMRMRNKRSGNNILFSSLVQVVADTGMGEKNYLEGLRRVTFARCPFSRLWSAYVDKLMLPNPYYWKTWGYPAMNSTTRGDPSVDSASDDSAGKGFPPGKNAPSVALVECGQSVTFAQFLRFTLNDLHKRDTHVRPVSDECAPCYVNYDVIGHVETLTRDILYLAKLLGLSDSRLKGVNWEEDYAVDAIQEGVKNVFYRWAPAISQCMRMEEAGRRLWLVLQVRGIISETIVYPFERAGHPVTGVMMEEALMRARSQSAGLSEELRVQKETVLLSAYKAVSRQLKSGIRQVYADDFRMFGFDELLDL